MLCDVISCHVVLRINVMKSDENSVFRKDAVKLQIIQTSYRICGHEGNTGREMEGLKL